MLGLPNRACKSWDGVAQELYVAKIAPLSRKWCLSVSHGLVPSFQNPSGRTVSRSSNLELSLNLKKSSVHRGLVRYASLVTCARSSPIVQARFVLFQSWYVTFQPRTFMSLNAQHRSPLLLPLYWPTNSNSKALAGMLRCLKFSTTCTGMRPRGIAAIGFDRD